MGDVKSLNAIYHGEDRIFYWCNSVGEINVPGHPDFTWASNPCTKDDLPPSIRKLYETYQNEDACGRKYTVTLDGKNGMMIVWLFDEDYIDGMMEQENEGFVKGARIEDRTLISLAASMAEERIAREVSRQYPTTTVLLGEGTDPLGDEIGIFLPEWNMCQWNNIVDHVDDWIYSEFELEFKENIDLIRKIKTLMNGCDNAEKAEEETE